MRDESGRRPRISAAYLLLFLVLGVMIALACIVIIVVSLAS